MQGWRRRAAAAKQELWALYLAYRNPRVPWYARAVALCVVGYAFSPIDLIPDPIPVLGYLDDLVLLPAGVLLARRLIPPEVLAECRAEAAGRGAGAPRPRSRVAAALIVAVWAALAAGAVALSARLLAGG